MPENHTQALTHRQKMKLIFTLTVAAIIFFAACAKPTDACFTHSPAIITTTTAVTFDASCTKNGGYSYKWSFADGTKDTTIMGTPAIVHLFPSKGTFNVTLTAGRKDGSSLKQEHPTQTQTITVQ